MMIVVCIIFLFSGASALTFEVLWFHLTGLVLGNSVWATSIVLASFMGGMALGNALVAARGDRIKKPLSFYALLEVIIAVSGVGLVFILPKLSEMLVPVYHLLGQNLFLLNLLRAILAFLFLVIPTSAMGATLPVLVKALYARNQSFGRVLGWLYGWNTLGAMIGVIACELWLLRFFGIRGAGVFAGSLNLLAAFIALAYYAATKDIKVISQPRQQKEDLSISSFAPMRLLSASFLSGFTFLALEVLWFRFILLFVNATGWSFAVMLAMVLAGISLGGLLVSEYFRWRSDVYRFLLPTVLLNGILIIVLYANLTLLMRIFEGYRMHVRVVFISFFLIFPISCISGMIFTMIGKALHAEMRSETRATGLLTLANTIGGTCGSLLATLIFIPSFGVEKSFLGLAVCYGIIGILVAKKAQILPVRINKVAYHVMMGMYVLALLFFPFGFMERYYLSLPIARYRDAGERRVAMKEGVTETIQYLQKDLLTIPYYYRLLTNNFSMSGTNMASKRYMKLFVYLPTALNKDPRNALLICYGCGITAKALTDTASFEKIDVVDISKDIVESSQVVYPVPGYNPINDPRVRVHIEDGRFFLLTTDQKYDLITAEPPPPKHSGVVNLYTQEYFQLIYDRLAEGGMVTYWLPVYQLTVEESKAIIKGFCNVFDNCSLWTGSNLDWIMVGVKLPVRPVTEQEFARQWADPIVSPEMQALGFDDPEELGAFFIADGERLNGWIKDSLPLTDNYPQRLLSYALKRPILINAYTDLMDGTQSQKNFIGSETVGKMWPEKFRQAAASYFPVRQVINDLLAPSMLKSHPSVFYLHQCLQNPLLKNYLPWVLDSDHYAQQILQKAQQTIPEHVFKDPEAYPHLAASALQEGNFRQAEQYLHQLIDMKPWPPWDESSPLKFCQLRIYLLYLSGDVQQAMNVGLEYVQQTATDTEKRSQEMKTYWNWLVDTLGKKEIPSH